MTKWSKCRLDLSKRCLNTFTGVVIIPLYDLDLFTHCLIVSKSSVVLSKCYVELSKRCLFMSKNRVIIFLRDVDLSRHCLIM